MLDVGFINPSSDYLFDPFKGDPHTHFQILTVLEDRLPDKVNPTLIDLRGIKREFAVNHIPEKDVFLHSVYTLDYEEQEDLVRNLRERYPKAKHIAGGPHATTFREDSSKVFDSLILGDGEETLIQALEDIENSKLKKVYQQEGQLDVNAYPYARRHFLPESAVARKGLLNLRNDETGKDLLGTTVIFSRGCPYKCAFCEMPAIREYNMGIRFRNPENVKAEIEYLKKDYGIEGLNLLDEIALPLVKRKAVAHLEAIADTGIKWRGQCRVDGIDSELAKLAKESGCVSLGLGVESASQKSLDIINKRIDVEKSKETIKLLGENGIDTRVYMILGLPGEPKDIVERTWNFIEETNPSVVHLSLFTVRPGTPLYNNPEKYGLTNINQDWKKTMHMFGRYEDETPELTFEYVKNPPWGEEPFTNDQIIANYMELQDRLKERSLGTL